MAISTIKMKITAKTYGFTIAKALGWSMMKMGASEEVARRWAMRLIFIRVGIGGKYKSWVWGGKS